MRIRPVLYVLLAGGVVAACHKGPPKAPPLSSVLPYVPLPPQAQPLASQSGADATQIVAVSPIGPDSVAAYYRDVLSKDPFRLINERTVQHTTVFYAEQNGPSIWITVQPNGTDGSQVTIAGAKDTTKVADSVRAH
ncbi:MAG TPA: hypothetical protein VGM20_00895 [Gemmatimonadales bacterium]|jgi:hypothetical protein